MRVLGETCGDFFNMPRVYLSCESCSRAVRKTPYIIAIIWAQRETVCGIFTPLARSHLLIR